MFEGLKIKGMRCEMEPQSTMVIPVQDELVLMNLPPCWRSDAGGGGAGALRKSCSIIITRHLLMMVML